MSAALNRFKTVMARAQGKIELTDPNTADELRLDFDGVHFLLNGSIFAFAEPTG